jgi:hypothetical protein
VKVETKFSTWNYVCVDDFLEVTDLRRLTGLAAQHSAGNPNEIKIFQSRTSDLKNSFISPDYLEELKLKYEPVAIEILKSLAPKKVSLFDFSSFQISITKKGATYPVHVDQPEKILSGVVYLSPTNSTGTFLHASEKDLHPFEVDWKVNRAFFFSRHPEFTWHSYRGDSRGDRITLVFNLMTRDLRKHQIIDMGISRYFFHSVSRRVAKVTKK